MFQLKVIGEIGDTDYQCADVPAFLKLGDRFCSRDLFPIKTIVFFLTRTTTESKSTAHEEECMIEEAGATSLWTIP